MAQTARFKKKKTESASMLLAYTSSKQYLRLCEDGSSSCDKAQKYPVPKLKRRHKQKGIRELHVYQQPSTLYIKPSLEV